MKNERSTRYYFFKFGYTLFLALLVGGGYFFRHDISALLEGESVGHKQPAKVEQSTTGSASEKKKEKKIKYWVAPMDPTYIRSEPGKSLTGMDLVPVYEDGDEDTGGIKISPVVEQNIGVRTENVQVREISKVVRTVGRVAYDERKVAYVQSKTKGWVEKLYVDFTGEEVKNGDYLLEIYSPELVATQEEYILALSYRDSISKSSVKEVATGGESLLAATRRRLELFDMPEHQIKELEEKREVKKTLHIHSPTDGVVVSKHVVTGMQVTPGMTMYKVADLSRVWVIADIYEYEVPWVRLGQKVSMTLQSLPGKVFRGKVTYIYPYLDKKTRTVQVRMEFDNPGLKLKPDMYANVEIVSRVRRKGMVAPIEAVIRSGSRNVVMLARDKGRFEAREVTLGVEFGGYYEILKGLSPGDKIVTSANFLLDSESNLKEAINKMLSKKQEKTSPAKHADKESPETPDTDIGHEGMKGMKMDHSKMQNEKMKRSGTNHQKHEGK